MKRDIKISNRATGPVTPVSYRALARRRLSRASGDQAVSVVDFICENQRGQTIQVSLKNDSSTDKTFAIYPGRLTTPAEISRYAGVAVDAIVQEGVVTDNNNPFYTCSSKTLNLAQGWIKDHPMRFCLMKLSTDNEGQFQREIGVAAFGLGKTDGIRTIRPIDFVSPDQLNKTLCEINCSLQLDDSTVFFAEVGAGRTLDITLQIVSEMNQADTLSDIVNSLE